MSDTIRPGLFGVQQRPHPFDQLDELAEENGFTPEAVELVLEAVREALSNHVPGQHTSAAHVVDAFVEIVWEYFWDEKSAAAQTLIDWGIKDSSDIGRIVFAMVKAGWYTASPTDREEDFNGLFVTSALFDARNCPEEA